MLDSDCENCETICAVDDGGNGTHSKLDWQIATLALVAHKVVDSVAALNALATDTDATPEMNAEVRRNITQLMEECMADLERMWPRPE